MKDEKKIKFLKEQIIKWYRKDMRLICVATAAVNQLWHDLSKKRSTEPEEIQYEKDIDKALELIAVLQNEGKLK
tara:strand:+ start:271 stop:492 length:222 start_codon:yes stop_codon:yes gene_type:complete